MTMSSLRQDQSFSADSLLSCAPPHTLGAIDFTYKGIHFHVYGVLHGITGGMNAEYRSLLTESVASAQGIVFAEKGLFALLRDVRRPVSLCDWAVITPWDAFGMGLRLVLLPAAWRMFTLDVLREVLLRHDPFPRSRQIADLGGSPYFHLIDPWERRRLVGFPEPEDGLRYDLRLLANPWRDLWPRRPQTISAAWNRLLQIVQRHGHIPCRSLHMLAFATEYACCTKSKEVSLFVGETHNTDMAWLAEHGVQLREQLDAKSKRVYACIEERSSRLARLATVKNWRVSAAALLYFLSLLMGATCGLVLLLTIAVLLLTAWIRISAIM